MTVLPGQQLSRYLLNGRSVPEAEVNPETLNGG